MKKKKSKNNITEKGNLISIIPSIKELWFYISNRRKRQLIIVLVFMTLAALSELISLAAVIPFLKVLSNPIEAFRDPLISNIAKFFNINNSNAIILPLTLLFCLAIIFASFIRLITLYISLRLCASISSDLSCEAYRRALYQSYDYHLKINTSEVLNASTTQIRETNVLIYNCLVLITSALIAISLYLGLLLINWKIAIISAFIFGFSYYFLALNLKERLSMNSYMVANLGEKQIKNMREGLGAIKDILLTGNQNLYYETYKGADLPMRIKTTESTFLSYFPRYGFEALGMLFIACLALFSSNDPFSGKTIILLGSFALAAQKLLPAIQNVYSSWAIIKSFASSLEKVLELLRLDNHLNSNSYKKIKRNIFKSSIKLKNISFSYSRNEKIILDNINLEVQTGEKIGLIGKTGCGKSTLIDILIGLLKPTNGFLLIDDNDIYDKKNKSYNQLKSWRASIAYVPQNIYLTDTSIIENIAFGIDKNQIDKRRVIYSAKVAQIHKFIENLPNKYDTYIGERGVRLSGGQCQRIGIARAIYKNLKVLVLDEATSALDNATENALMKSLDTLNKDITIFMIAHRLSTLNSCDKIFELSSGKLILKNL